MKKKYVRYVATLLAATLVLTMSGITAFASTAGSNSAVQQTVSGNDMKSGMDADTTKGNTETIKTGEFDMRPIIIGLAVISAAAGTGYAIYRKKNR